jgi:hypothetical protein
MDARSNRCHALPISVNLSRSPTADSTTGEIPAWNMQFVFANSSPAFDRAELQLAARTGEGAPGA